MKKIISPASVTITAEATSPRAIEKLLEQALFELRHNSKSQNGFDESFVNSAKGDQKGTMGSYSFEYVKPEYEFEADY